jgi:predicted ester cyclase
MPMSTDVFCRFHERRIVEVWSMPDGAAIEAQVRGDTPIPLGNHALPK